jgi:hypothetical protein
LAIPDECRIARTIRRSLIAHSRNMQIPIGLLKFISCWRIKANSATSNPWWDMLDIYCSSNYLAVFVGTLTFDALVLSMALGEFLDTGGLGTHLHVHTRWTQKCSPIFAFELKVLEGHLLDSLGITILPDFSSKPCD